MNNFILSIQKEFLRTKGIFLGCCTYVDLYDE